jgi:hypothetical protein
VVLTLVLGQTASGQQPTTQTPGERPKATRPVPDPTSQPRAAAVPGPAREKAPDAAAHAPKRQVQFFILHDAAAPEMVATLRELYAGDDSRRVRIALHATTNTVIVMGQAEDLETISTIIMRLETLAREVKKRKAAEKNTTG